MMLESILNNTPLGVPISPEVIEVMSTPTWALRCATKDDKGDTW